MLLNYLKIAFRHYRRQKGFTLINLFGLTAGIASSLVIFVFVRHEMSYDSFRPDLDRIYRVAVGSPDQGSATISAPVARVLKDNFPEVESVARILRFSPGLVGRGEVRFFEDRRMYADGELFEILGDLVSSVDQTQGRIQITDPQDDCPLVQDCPYLPMWRRAETAIKEVYDTTTIADLLNEEAAKA